ncbi:uncharacterized protein EAF01_000649 [Botrytis porri]|uniref:uncharacterized protein n=1 Tax=Botrytis porri TaxID=87229 RepID=UPI0018FF3982|nr:uncharacterized protein EAF01_000649 [Botrytis porri]KAF7914243.1 hypothetical protein EAF01_000649 [Botrytis porri]
MESIQIRASRHLSSDLSKIGSYAVNRNLSRKVVYEQDCPCCRCGIVDVQERGVVWNDPASSGEERSGQILPPACFPMASDRDSDNRLSDAGTSRNQVTMASMLKLDSLLNWGVQTSRRNMGVLNFRMVLVKRFPKRKKKRAAYNERS